MISWGNLPLFGFFLNREFYERCNSSNARFLVNCCPGAVVFSLPPVPLPPPPPPPPFSSLLPSHVHRGGNVNMQLDRYLRLLSKHRQSPALAWVGFLLLSLVVWKLVSDGDFSFIMTYGAFARTFGFGLLAVKLWTARSATGVSFKTLQLYALVGRRRKQEGERDERGRAESRREGGRVLVGNFLGI